MKIYLMTDLEGVAGVYQWESRDDVSLENHERRCRQRRWLAQEVNAAADGLFAAGATEIIVNDGELDSPTVTTTVFMANDLITLEFDRGWNPAVSFKPLVVSDEGLVKEANHEGTMLTIPHVIAVV